MGDVAPQNQSQQNEREAGSNNIDDSKIQDDEKEQSGIWTIIVFLVLSFLSLFSFVTLYYEMVFF